MTAANLPGGPGTQSSPLNTDGGQPNLPEPSNIQTKPDLNGMGPGAGGPGDVQGLPPVAPLEPMTTKPRQMPGGPGGPSGPMGQPMPGAGAPPMPGGNVVPGETPPAPVNFDADAAGFAQQQASAPTGAPEGAEPKKAHRFVAVLSDVRRDNPGLPLRQAISVAQQTMGYLRAEDDDPLAVVDL